MDSGSRQVSDSALRPLRHAAPTTAALRAGTLSETDATAAVVQVAAAVEMSLRRFLRDLPAASIEVRLRALAPDELRADEVLAELRQHDQISIELAAAVHDLLDARQRLRDGARYTGQDGSLAYHVADRLEHEVRHPRQPVAAPVSSVEPDEEDFTMPAAGVHGRRGRLATGPGGGGILFAVLALLVVAAATVWWMRGRDTGSLDEGIALFRSGAYEDAARAFAERSAANPEDATPRLYLARIHRRMGDTVRAVAQLDSALRLAPEDADVQSELGFLLIDTGHPEQAVERFRSALLLEPQSEPAWTGLVAALRADDRADAAERVLERAPPAVRTRLADPVGATPPP